MTVLLALLLLLAPAVGFLAGLWLTRRLAPPRKAPAAAWRATWKTGLPMALLIGLLPLGGVSWRDAPLLPPWAPLLMVALALHARDLARHGFPAWRIVGPFAWSSLMWVGLALALFLRHRREPIVPLVDPAWLGAAALALYVLLPVGELRPWAPHAPARLPIVFARGIGLLLLLWVAWGAWRAEARAPEQIERYVGAFDAPLDELLRWEQMGRAAAWLARRDRRPDLEEPRARLREALAAGRDVHPTALQGAIEAGLLEAEDFRQLLAAEGPRSAAAILGGEGPLVFTLSQPVHVRAVIESGELTEARRAHLVDRLAASWPTEPGIGRLEDARQIADLLARLGARDRIEAHAPALRAMLRRSWCETAPSFAMPGGFSAYDTDEVHAPDDGAALDALDLMRHVGVPAGIDLAAFEAHLHHETRPRGVRLGRDLSYLDLQAHLAWHRLHDEHEIAHDLAYTLRRWAEPLAAALLIAFLTLCALRGARTAAAKASDDDDQSSSGS